MKESGITTKHICNICGAHFPVNELEAALKHASVPITEGNFDMIVLREGRNDSYLLCHKTNEVNYSHERLYNFMLLCQRTDIEIFKDYSDSKEVGRYVQPKPLWIKQSGSEIKNSVERGQRLPLTSEELKDVKGIINRTSLSSFTKEMKTL